MNTTDPDSSHREFAAFMQAYQDMVFSTAVRLLGNDAQAEDIAQEVFLKAYEHFDQLQNSTSAGGWLKTVATNLSLNHLSRYRRRWRLFSELPADQGEDKVQQLEATLPESLFDGLQREQQSTLIEAALMKLPAQQRVPLVLWHFEELAYEHIAQRLNISLAKVKIDIHRGRIALARLLQS